MEDDSNIGLIESLLVDSRITPTGNGAIAESDISVLPPLPTLPTLPDTSINPVNPVNPVNSQVTSGQKWWAAVILGFIFFLISSPVAYNITSQITLSTVGTPLMYGTGPTLAGLLFHTLIFVLIVRLILW